jgi:sorbitol-specific phosphotransferase system component IIA
MPVREALRTVRPMSRHLLLGAVLAAPLLLTPSASAAYTLGASPEIAGEATPLIGCAPATCTVAQDRYANEALRVRERGVVVRWRVSGEGGQARLRRVGGGATAAEALPTTVGPAEFLTRLPVAPGDTLAVDLLDGAHLSREPDPLQIGGYVANAWVPALGDGETRAPSESFEGYWLYQVDVEPDNDGDGLGDETQDPDGGVPPTPPGPPAPPSPPSPPTPPGPGPSPDVPRVETPRVEPPRAGPTLKFAGKASATKKGAVAVSLVNPYDVALKGTLTLKQGRRKAGSAKVSLAARGERTVSVRLSKPAARALTRKRTLKLSAALTLRGPSGKARTTRATVTAKLGPAPRRPTPRTETPTRPGRDDGRAGLPFDGTYRAPDGQVMVVENGRVLTFSGMISTYCTRTAKQRNIDYGMFGDDPDPVVAADGSFAYEATRGYGFIKLKFDGRIKGDVASGRMVVEDRSPLLGTGRFEFDYCFAGKEWTLTR